MADQLDYGQAGYDRFFRKQATSSSQNFGREGNNDNTALQVYNSQQTTPSDQFLGADPTTLQQIPGNNVQGGVIQSNNGNLTLDLTNGIFNYTDGVRSLFSISPETGVQINDKDGNSLVSTSSNNSVQTQTNNVGNLTTGLLSNPSGK